MSQHFYTYVLVAVGSALALTGMVMADDDHDHDQARRLREAGDILPLETILQRAQARHPGRVLEVELESEHGSHVYEIEILDAQGVVQELYFDAHSGELLKTETEP